MTRRRRLLWLTAALMGFTVLLGGWTVESIMLHGETTALPPAGRPLVGQDVGPATSPTGQPVALPARPRPTGGVTPIAPDSSPSTPTSTSPSMPPSTSPSTTPSKRPSTWPSTPPSTSPSTPAVPVDGGVQIPVTGCPSEQVLVSYVSRYTVAPSPGYKVMVVHLSALQTACQGTTVTVRLAAAAGSAGDVQSSVPYAPGVLDVPFVEGEQMLAQDVRAVQVTLS